MGVLKSLRFWLFVWVGIGAVLLAYVIIASSVQPGGRKKAGAPSVYTQSQALLTGQMSDFAYAFPPRGAPEGTFYLDDDPVSVRNFRGTVVLVNFWATWCAPCLKELPSLDRLQAHFNSEPFQVVAIAADPRGPVVAQQYLDKLEIKNLRLYTDPKLRFTAAIGGANVLPVSILFGRDGSEIGRIVGEADWSSPEALALIRSTLNS